MDINTIIKAIQETPPDYLALAICISVSIWLFKEIRNTYQKSTTDNLNRIEKSLSVYTKAFRGMCKFENKEITIYDLSVELESLPPVCSKKVLKLYIEWELDKNTSLDEFKKSIQNEMNFHKTEQDNELTYWINFESISEV